MAQPSQQQSYFQHQQFPPTNMQATTSPGLLLPPHKRQRVDSPSQPPAQFTGMSPTPSPSTPAVSSPLFTNVGIPTGAYNTPYTPNGLNSANLNLPQTSQNPPPYQPPTSNLQPQNQNNQSSAFNNYSMNTQAAGTMGPPLKPTEKSKEDGIDPMDVLGGTGIDLREEEQYSFQYSGSFNSQLSGSHPGTISAGHSFSQFPPGDEASLYGAGPANAAAEKVNVDSQEKFHQQAADKAWYAASRDLDISREKELASPFLTVGFMHAKMQRIARENGLSLNIEKNGTMGHMKFPVQFENRNVQVQTVPIANEAFLTVTQGGFVPLDSMLVDHLALLSIATKHRLRGLIESADKLAKGRQTGSHGIVPEEWADAAAPVNSVDSSLMTEGAVRSGWESAVSPDSNPLKRSFSAVNKLPTPVSDGGKSSQSATKISNEVVAALRQTAKAERDFEEARLKKRNARSNGDMTATPRQGSILPGTPGSIAPEISEKAPTKKEQKKKAEAKVNEAASHAAANVTTAQFLSSGGGLFGKKKKKYDWMNAAAGGSASGASTPGRLNTQGHPGTPTAMIPERLTAEGARRLGSWREDKDKGLKIQIRDWITVLEEDGHDKRSLQKAYMNLDNSEPK